MYSVFLADDERWVVFGLRKLIEKSELPFQVIGEAYDGVTTLEEVMEKKPDILITDIRMPGCSGLELLEKIQEKKLDIRVIMVSGYADFEYARRSLRGGASDYLLKPVEQERMNEILDRLMKKINEERGISGQKREMELPEIHKSVDSKIVSEIREHYTENITLSELSKKYGLSVGHLSNLVREELGLTFSEYITAKRMQRAKELLSDASLSINEVAEQSGYNDYFYFTKVFKKYMGISPSKYRKNL